MIQYLSSLRAAGGALAVTGVMGSALGTPKVSKMFQKQETFAIKLLPNFRYATLSSCGFDSPTSPSRPG
jgi:hypothetical protein